MELRSQSYDTTVQNVAEPREERVDGSFGLVLGLARGRQEQGLPHGVLDRIVGGVFEDLVPADKGTSAIVE